MQKENTHFTAQLDQFPGMQIPDGNFDFPGEMIFLQDSSVQTNAKDSHVDIFVDLANSLNYCDSQDSQTIDSNSENLRIIRTRIHLTRPRRRRQNQKSKIQSSIKGYWTKNFLPVGKNPHFKWLIQEKGLQFLKENLDLEFIRTKIGISMEDYIYLYQHQSLQETWERFFRCKFLHREVMLSRASGKSKVVFFKFLHRFQQAYKTGEFDHIA